MMCVTINFCDYLRENSVVCHSVTRRVAQKGEVQAGDRTSYARSALTHVSLQMCVAQHRHRVMLNHGKFSLTSRVRTDKRRQKTA